MPLSGSNRYIHCSDGWFGRGLVACNNDVFCVQNSENQTVKVFSYLAFIALESG